MVPAVLSPFAFSITPCHTFCYNHAYRIKFFIDSLEVYYMSQPGSIFLGIYFESICMLFARA